MQVDSHSLEKKQPRGIVMNKKAAKKTVLERLNLSARTCAAICAAALFLSLVPMLLLARYDYPSWDDFNWVVSARNAVGSGASVFAVALEGAKISINEFFGNAIGFFNALMPDIFSAGAGGNTYMWGAIIHILLFALSAFVFAYVCCRRLLRCERAAGIIAASLFTLIAMQFVPSGLEAFYSYVLAVSYTFPVCLQFLGGALIIYLCSKASGSLRSDWLKCALALAVTFCAGLFTYFVPSLALVLVCAALAAWAFAVKGKGRFVITGAATGAVAAFVITLLSGGAQNRAADQIASASPVRAVLSSILFSGLYAGRWLNVPVLILIGFIVATLWSDVKRSPFSFKLPGLATLLALGIYCSVGVPVVYARGGRGSGRIFNCEFWAFLLALLFIALYWAGWFAKKHHDGIKLSAQIKSFKGALVLTLCAVLLLSCVQLDRFDIFDAEQPMAVEQPITSLSAAWSLLTGEAAAYAAEREARLAVLLDEKVSDAVFEPIETRPYLLFYRDLDYGDVAGYYGKASVSVKGGEK